MLAVYDEDTLLASLLSWKPAQQGLSHRFTGLHDAVAISPPYIGSGLRATACVSERPASEMKTYAGHLMIHPEQQLFCGEHVRPALFTHSGVMRHPA